MSSNTSVETSMVPWLHFDGGDHLLFQSLAPTSKGAIAGACIVLVLLSLFERWVAASRALLESQWKRNALALLSGRGSEQLPETCCDETKSDVVDVQEVPSSPAGSSSSLAASPSKSTMRTIPPFIASHDIPRGAIHALQALLSYALMLSVMTFQAAYLLSVVFGLGLGEVLFGRMGGRSHIH
ncbi:Ctr copper transporter [Athelia psychrophila]|uniref:Copper transport protein n=1 Tax=Athelia psychrophila TaxID=1759441 RepID=A0A167V1T4_9AGAM|nr:Ctr copper transporter [Fibularhizoctonia sp. CBS 109695]